MKQVGGEKNCIRVLFVLGMVFMLAAGTFLVCRFVQQKEKNLIRTPVCYLTPEQLEEEVSTKTEDPLLLLPAIFAGEDTLPLDTKEGTYYLSLGQENPSFPDGLEARGELANGRLVMTDVSQIEDLPGFIRGGGVLQGYWIEENTYRSVQFVCTTLPVLSFSTKDNFLQEMHGGMVQGYWASAAKDKESGTFSLTLQERFGLCGLGAHDEWKCYEIGKEDPTRIRALLAVDTWNSYAEEELKRDACLAEVISGGKYEGLYLLEAAPETRLSLHEGSYVMLPGMGLSDIEAEQIENLDEYVLYTQLVCGYKNTFDHYVFYEHEGTGSFLMVPKKTRFTFGGMPRNLSFLSDHAEKRFFGVTDFGFGEEKESALWSSVGGLLPILSQRGITADNLVLLANIRAEELLSSGYMAREEFGVDYPNELQNLFSFIMGRGENLAAFYANPANIPASQWENHVEIVTAVGNEQYAFRFFTVDEEAYLFLPSFVTAQNLFVQFEDERYAVALNGQQLQNGAAFQTVPGEEMTMAVAEIQKGVAKQYTLHVQQSANLSGLYLIGDNEDLSWLNLSKDNWEAARLIKVNAVGEVEENRSVSKMHARGNTSFTRADKKNYSLRFAEGDRKILIANGLDPSDMRNMLSMQAAQAVMPGYALFGEAVDLFYNGHYMGNYIYGDPVEAVECDYLLEVTSTDQLREEDVFIDAYLEDLKFVIDVPKIPSAGEQAALADFTKEVMEKIDAAEDPGIYAELTKLIDAESFAKMYLFNLIVDEADANYASCFYFVRDEKLWAGPLWDLDKILGNYREYKKISPDMNSYVDGLPEKLYEKSPQFRELVKNTFNDVLAPYFMTLMSDGTMKELERASVSMDVIRNAPINADGAMENWEESFEGARTYLNKRLSLTGQVVNEGGSYVKLSFRKKSGDRSYYVEKGNAISADIWERIKSLYHKDSFALVDGTVINEADLIVQDMNLDAN